MYILDRFGVSIQAYYEITQLEGNDTMARSYVIEECQADLNESVKISRTPGEYPGAEMNFPDLLEEQVIKHVSDKTQHQFVTERCNNIYLGSHLTLWVLFLCVSMKSKAKSQQMVTNYR